MLKLFFYYTQFSMTLGLSSTVGVNIRACAAGVGAVGGLSWTAEHHPLARPTSLTQSRCEQQKALQRRANLRLDLAWVLDLIHAVQDFHLVYVVLLLLGGLGLMRRRRVKHL